MCIAADLSDQCFGGNAQSITGTDDVAKGPIFTSKLVGKLPQSTAESFATAQISVNINESSANIQWCSMSQKPERLAWGTSGTKSGY
jgi:hypothetical protein